MRKIHVVLLCVFTIVLSGCFKSAEYSVESNGIAFTCPSGWEVSDTEDYGGTYTLTIEKNGFSESGLVSILWLEEEADPMYYLELMQEILNEDPLANFTHQKTIESKYGNYDVTIAEYTMKCLNVPHQGRIIVFSDNGKTVCLVEQGANEDKKKNASGFKQIEESFSLD